MILSDLLLISNNEKPPNWRASLIRAYLFCASFPRSVSHRPECIYEAPVAGPRPTTIVYKEQIPFS